MLDDAEWAPPTVNLALCEPYERRAIENGGIYISQQDWIDQVLVPYLTATGQAGEVERTLGDEGLQVLAKSVLVANTSRYYDATAAYPEHGVLDRLIRMLVERRSYGALYAAVTDVRNAAMLHYIRECILEGEEPGALDYPPDEQIELWAGDWSFDGYDWVLGDPASNGCLTIDPQCDQVLNVIMEIFAF